MDKFDLNVKRSQMQASLCMGLVFIFIGIPIWWKTTEVYRADLPYAAIEDLAKNTTLSTEIAITLVSGTNSEAEMIEQQFVSHDFSEGSKFIDIHYNFKSIVLNENGLKNFYQKAKDGESEDGAVEENEIMIFFFASDEIDNSHIYLSRHRSIFVGIPKVSLQEEIKIATASIMQLIKETVVNSMSLEDVMCKAYGVTLGFSKDREVHMMKTIRPSKGYDIVFSLICPEPDKLQATWNIEEAVSSYLNPMITKLGEFSDFVVGSQILYYSGLSKKPKSKKGDDGSIVYYLTYKQLSHVINPIESRLGAQISPNPTLNFVVYVAEEKYNPQFVEMEDGTFSETNTFLVPRWGAIKIHNFKKSEEDDQPRFEKLESYEMMGPFLGQLRALLGIENPGNYTDIEIVTESTDGSALRDWELDYLVRARAVENIATSMHTLNSLAKLLGKIGNIVINDNIAREVYSAVDAIHKARKHLGHGQLKKALHFSNIAFRSSEIAFFDPTLLELLYFPEDQKFAIYIPLFLPIALPLIGSFLSALRWLKRKEKVKSD